MPAAPSPCASRSAPGRFPMSGILHARRCGVVARVGLSLLVMAAAVPHARAADTPTKKLDADQVQKDMARVRAQLDAQRNRMLRGMPPQSRRQAAEALRNAEKRVRTRTEASTGARAAQALSYRLVPGMT